jgi:hypothetical protein
MPFANGVARELLRAGSSAMQIVRARGFGPETKKCDFVDASSRHCENGFGPTEFEQHAGKIEH